MKSMSGLYSITWKCSTACIDLRDLQFLNQITYKHSVPIKTYNEAREVFTRRISYTLGWNSVTECFIHKMIYLFPHPRR